MGHCNHCGAPCPNCTEMTDDLTLLALPEQIRDEVKRVLRDVGATQQQQDSLVKKLLQYSPEQIHKAYLSWKNGGCAGKAVNENYFLGILKRVATQKSNLEALPPLIP